MVERKGSVMVGTCNRMCPDDEFMLRKNEDLLHPLELTKRNGRLEVDISKVVKEFSRSAAGRREPRPCDVRPPSVLKATVQYLLSSVCSIDSGHWSDVYDFVFDRLRAVRQDMVLQELDGMEAVEILENIIRFHIYAGYRLCDQPINKFDPKINDQHTQECLKRLLYLYRHVDGSHSNREEFESLYLIFNLGHTDALMHYYDLPQEIRSLPMVNISYLVSISYVLKNYIRTLRLLISSRFEPYPLCLCAAHRHLVFIQRKALEVMSCGYNSKSLIYPSHKLVDLLWFEDMSQCLEECKKCGILVKNDENIIFQKSSFKDPGKVMVCHISGIDSILCKQTIPEILLGSQVKQAKDEISELSHSLDSFTLDLKDSDKVT